MRCVLRAQRGEDHAGGLSVHFGAHALCSTSCDATAQASGLEFEQILKDKLAQLGCDIYDGAFFDEVCYFEVGGAYLPSRRCILPVAVCTSPAVSPLAPHTPRAGALEACRHAQDSGHSVDHSYLRERQGGALDRLKSVTRFAPAPHFEMITTSCGSIRRSHGRPGYVL